MKAAGIRFQAKPSSGSWNLNHLHRPSSEAKLFAGREWGRHLVQVIYIAQRFIIIISFILFNVSRVSSRHLFRTISPNCNSPPLRSNFCVCSVESFYCPNLLSLICGRSPLEADVSLKYFHFCSKSLSWTPLGFWDLILYWVWLYHLPCFFNSPALFCLSATNPRDDSILHSNERSLYPVSNPLIYAV